MNAPGPGRGRSCLYTPSTPPRPRQVEPTPPTSLSPQPPRQPPPRSPTLTPTRAVPDPPATATEGPPRRLLFSPQPSRQPPQDPRPPPNAFLPSHPHHRRRIPTPPPLPPNTFLPSHPHHRRRIPTTAERNAPLPHALIGWTCFAWGDEPAKLSGGWGGLPSPPLLPHRRFVGAPRKASSLNRGRPCFSRGAGLINPARRWSGPRREVGIDRPSGDLFSRGLNATSSVARWGETSLRGAPTNLRWGKAVGGASPPHPQGKLGRSVPPHKDVPPHRAVSRSATSSVGVGLAHVGGKRARPGGAETGCEATWVGRACAAWAGGGQGWRRSMGSGFGLAGRRRGCEAAWCGSGG
ncbi:hypothetical protein CLV40_103168 [Actinokineospora auranticolor]|uniref:Uncharacterized protein n=1 Tax=Actinokineospora auranticolor TaxID=155976 RepID=A0A2S6GWI4_9PSEU|nr:hypothetical protein CLV40_103168 [Actinokineospora auranticolor]